MRISPSTNGRAEFRARSVGVDDAGERHRQKSEESRGVPEECDMGARCECGSGASFVRPARSGKIKLKFECVVAVAVDAIAGGIAIR